MTIEELKNKEVEVVEGVFVKCSYIKEEISPTYTGDDGSLCGGYKYLLFSDNGFGWYQYYTNMKIREAQIDQIKIEEQKKIKELK